MGRRTNTYRGANAPKRGAEQRASQMGQLARLRDRMGRVPARIAGLRPRREIVVLASLGLALIVGLASIGGAWLLYRNDRDWTAVASVNGHDISREALRSRMAVLAYLAQERLSFLGEQASSGALTSDEERVLVTSAETMLASPVTAARESLIDDELLRQLAATQRVATPAEPDAWTEAATFASSDVIHTITYVRFGLTDANAATAATTPNPSSSAAWPLASAANVAAASERLTNELSAGTPVTAIVEGLHDAGWTVVGEDTAVSAAGLPADSSLELDGTIAAAALRGQDGTLLGPTTDAYGRVSAGRVLATPDLSHFARVIGSGTDAAKLDPAALQSWADGQALERAVKASLVSGWSKGVNEAHFRELVVGSAPDSSSTAGPWVELSALVVNQLAGVSAAALSPASSGLDLGADALVKTLGSMSAPDRISLFRTLVAAANKTSGAGGASTVSGELGFYTKDGVVPALGAAAFAEAARSGEVVGPISTPAGPELFLIEARYSGALDDRSRLALGQIRNDGSADPLTYTKLYSPADAALALDADWRAEPEFGTSEPVRSALFDSIIGSLSDPFVLDGKLGLALVSERKTGIPDARMLDRLSLDGYDAWFASALAKATISRSDHPLPELEPSPTASASAAASSGGVMPSLPVLDTPNLPAVPGGAAPTPARTDAMGLPALP